MTKQVVLLSLITAAAVDKQEADDVTAAQSDSSKLYAAIQ